MKRIFCIALIALSFCASAVAQHNFRTGYFLDGYAYKHKLNPAFGNDRGYFAIPILGYTTFGAETNLALSTFLYPDGNGNLTTFLSPNVPAEEFIGKIQKNNPLNFNTDMSILSLGFNAGKSFNTIDLAIKTDVRANVPGAFFSWAKQCGNSMDMSDLGLNASARLELSYGYSRSIGEKFRFGLKLKFLAGLAKASYSMDKLIVDMNADVWRVQSQGSGYLAAPAVGFSTDVDGVIDGFTLPSDYMQMLDQYIKSKNFGGAIDLGVSYDILSWLTVSASVTDLGLVCWNGVSKLGSDSQSVEYNGFENIGEGSVDMEGELSALGEELLHIVSPKVLSTEEKLRENLSMTAHAGVELRMPFWQRLSVGVLGTYRFDGPYSWWEARGSVNLALFRWLSFTANYAQSTYGESYGGAINFHPNVINIFVGVDSFKPALNVTRQFIPIDSFNTNLAVGVNFAFGKYHGRFPKKSKK